MDEYKKNLIKITMENLILMFLIAIKTKIKKTNSI